MSGESILIYFPEHYTRDEITEIRLKVGEIAKAQGIDSHTPLGDLLAMIADGQLVVLKPDKETAGSPELSVESL